MGLISVKLYADPSIKDNIKYRTGGLKESTVIASVSAVSNGNMANKNIYSDNSIEISLPLSTCAKANYIALTIENTVIAGQITAIEYINDTNTAISYVIDFFTTAQMTNAIRPGFFSSCYGLCRRTNITYPSESVVNQQSEPYSGNDIKVVDTKLTELFNNAVQSYTGINIAGGNTLFTMGYRLVLWLSSFAVDAIKKAGGAVTPWAKNPSAPTSNTVTKVNAFGGDPNTNVAWQQSFSTGMPLVFNSTTALTNYIDSILSNIGEYIEISPYGIEDDGVIARYVDVQNQYFYTTNEITESQATSIANVPMKQVKMITNTDILRIQILPEKFCTSGLTNYSIVDIDTGYGLNNFNPLKDERDTILPDGTVVQDFSKSKLMTYPYWYHQLTTRIGNTITLIPQAHMKIENYLNQGTYQIILRFVGGVMPKLLMCVNNKEDWGKAGFDKAQEASWITIYEYPTIPWANNVSSQQQIGELEARMKRLAQQQSAVIGASTEGTGFMYGFRGGKDLKGLGIMRSLAINVGRGFGELFNKEGANDWIKKDMQNELNSQTVMNNAGRVVTSEPYAIMAEGSIEMLFSQPLSVSRCGMTDGELFGFGRFIERRGQTCHLYINPITNSGSIFNGNASITSYGGKTYYEFFDLDVNGTMPIEFKNAIQQMFCGGCYLMS